MLCACYEKLVKGLPSFVLSFEHVFEPSRGATAAGRAEPPVVRRAVRRAAIVRSRCAREDRRSLLIEDEHEQ